MAASALDCADLSALCGGADLSAVEGLGNRAKARPLHGGQVRPATKREQVRALQSLLAEKFPVAAPKPGGTFPLRPGCELRRGVVTEFSSSTGAGALFLHALLAAARETRTFAALIDAGRTFDPTSYATTALARLLWVQCESAEQAVKAADLLLRDGNLPLLALDFQALPARALQRIPASTWHRFHRLAEQSTAAFVILTAQPMIEGAKARLAVRQRWSLRDLRGRRRELLGQLDVQVFARGESPTLLLKTA